MTHPHEHHRQGDGRHPVDRSTGRRAALDRLLHVLRHSHGHGHGHGDSLDQALLASRDGTRALWISLIGLLVTAGLQAVIVVLSSSVGLFADTVHNATDALTAIPIGLAFVIGRRPATSRYTYGFGRAEDLAGLAVVAVMSLSAATALWVAVTRLMHPHPVTHLWAVFVGGAIGFAGNELAAHYRIRVGRRIGSAALIADGRHARADGFASLAVVAGAIGVAVGWPLADPIVGLLISVAILAVLRTTARDVWRRLMDATEPETVEHIRQEALSIEGVVGADRVRVRWVGHELHASLDLVLPGTMSLVAAHDTAELVHHRLLHAVPRLVDVTIHTDPAHEPDADPHVLTAHHHHGSQ